MNGKEPVTEEMRRNYLRDRIQAEFMDAEHKYADNAKHKETLDLVGSIVQLIGFDSESKAINALKMAERLFEGLPLTAIEDKEEDWRFAGEEADHEKENEVQVYQAIRRPSLWRYEHVSGETVYFDDDIVDCIDINNPSSVIHSDKVNDIVNEMYPIKSLPYFPTKKYRAYVQTRDGKDGLYESLEILKLMLPSGLLIDINRNFRWNRTTNEWKEVTQNGSSDAAKIVRDVQ